MFQKVCTKIFYVEKIKFLNSEGYARFKIHAESSECSILVKLKERMRVLICFLLKPQSIPLNFLQFDPLNCS
jgi:hypothetical protein